MAKPKASTNSDPSYLNLGRINGMTLQFDYLGATNNTQVQGKTKPQSVTFLAMLKSMSDQYETSWESEDVWARMDAIYNYQNTKRKYNLTWLIPAWNMDEAKDNLRNIGLLANFLYPSISSKLYQKSDPNTGNSIFKANITDIRSPPILRLKFGNLIRDINTGNGLYGFIDGGFSVNFMLENGVFMEEGSSGDSVIIDKGIEQYYYIKDNLNIYPKLIELTISYRVLHTHKLGFDVATNSSDNESIDFFPYGFERNVTVDVANGGFSGESGDENKTNWPEFTEEELSYDPTIPIYDQDNITEGTAVDREERLRREKQLREEAELRALQLPPKKFRHKTIGATRL